MALSASAAAYFHMASNIVPVDVRENLRSEENRYAVGSAQ